MKKAVFVAIVALGAILCLVASQQGNAETVDEGFDSEFVAVTPKSNRNSFTVLKRPTYKIKCRENFLVGECIAHEVVDWRDWHVGKTVWIAIDDIAEIVEVKEKDIKDLEPEVMEAPEAPVPVSPGRRPTK